MAEREGMKLWRPSLAHEDNAKLNLDPCGSPLGLENFEQASVW